MATNMNTTVIQNRNLSNGMVIVGENGETITVEDAYESSTISGMLVVETTFGCLYLDLDGANLVDKDSI